MTIDEAIRLFAKFLDASWDAAMPLLPQRPYASTGQQIDDWLQANWELLVEQEVITPTGFLPPYGSGADIYMSISSRIYLEHAMPTHEIIMKPKNGEMFWDLFEKEYVTPEGLTFDHLVSFDQGWYYEKPPFNHVCSIYGYTPFGRSNNDRIILSLDDIVFDLKKID